MKITIITLLSLTIIIIIILNLSDKNDIINIIKSFDENTINYNKGFEKCNILYSNIIFFYY